MGLAMLDLADLILAGDRARTAVRFQKSRMRCVMGGLVKRLRYYRYEQGSRSPLPDADVENLITSTWARRPEAAGSQRRRDTGSYLVPDDQRRCTFGRRNSRARCDIDVRLHDTAGRSMEAVPWLRR